MKYEMLNWKGRVIATYFTFAALMILIILKNNSWDIATKIFIVAILLVIGVIGGSLLFLPTDYQIGKKIEI